MRVSPSGRAAICKREGCRLDAYRDTRGIWTIGVGHVNMTPPAVTPGMRITEAQADEFLAADLAPVEATIARCVRVPLSQNQVDALASLGFNIGINGLAKSTVVSRLNRRDYAGAADAILLWAHPSELLGRRKAERIQFLLPDKYAMAPGAEAVLAHVAPPAIHPAAPINTANISNEAATRASADTSLAGQIKPASILSRIAFFFGRH